LRILEERPDPVVVLLDNPERPGFPQLRNQFLALALMGAEQQRSQATVYGSEGATVEAMAHSDDVAAFLEDASGFRGSADRVVAPETVDQLRATVRQCAREHIPLTVSGAGTGLTGARVPQGGWVLSLSRFRKLEIVPGRAICGPSVSLADLHAAAARTNQFLGPNPTEISASVGGVISTNAGGARSFHYGALRKHVQALEVTFMDGETKRFQRGDRVDFPITAVEPPRVTKNAAGYLLQPELQWVDLIAGSEGTLGIVTEAELALFPTPPAILSGVVFFPTDDSAMQAVAAWRNIPELRLLEYMDTHGLRILREVYSTVPDVAAAALMIEQNLSSENDPQVDAWPERLEHAGALEELSWFGFTAADRERFRQFRHTLPSIVVERARRGGHPKYGTDFAVPFDRSPELHAFYRERCQAEFPDQYTIFGHAGDANNHVNLIPANVEQGQRGADLIREFAHQVIALGGTVAAEHGIGKTKTDLLKLMYKPEALDAMRQVKRRLDPNWLLGQGTLFEIN
jgi:FAD/FMN-containing dehydrogenase